LGQALGCGGYLSALRRTRIGEFEVIAAQTMESLVALYSSKS
jgi:tRNA U55 pseudouridine synthase TruB